MNDSDESFDRSSRSTGRLTISSIGQILPENISLKEITISWIDIRYFFKRPCPNVFNKIFRPKRYRAWKEGETRLILDGVLGEIRPGEMIGIMGGSGAGKSTMLNILAGKIVKGKLSGTVIVNGRPRDKKIWPFLMSYVEQDDILDENLTVLETVQFAVDMRNPNESFSKEERRSKAKRLIRALDLESISDRKVGSIMSSGISGGERKRLSIAIELAAERKVLFLDEPTSGLDAATSLALLEMLAGLAKKYYLSIIMAIHQPSGRMLEQLDKILLLSLGRTIFFGSLDEIQNHLKSMGFRIPMQENPADWIIDIISVDNSDSGANRQESLKRIANLHHVWQEIENENTREFKRTTTDDTNASRASNRSFRDSCSNVFRKSLAGFSKDARGSELITRYPNGSFDEFRHLLHRYFRIELRNFKTNFILVAEFICLGLVLGFVFFQLTTETFGGFQSRVGLFVLIPALVISLVSVELCILFSEKRQLILRERFSHLYRLRNSFGSNVLVMLPIRLVSVAVFSTIIYYLAGLRTDSFVYYLIYLGIILLVTLFGAFFGIFVASLCTTTLMSTTIQMIFVYIFVLYSGALAQSRAITPIVSWLRFLSPYFYCLQGLIQNECIGLTFAGQTGEYYVNLYDLNQFSIMWSAGALMIMCGVTFVAGYFSLRYTTKIKYIVL